MPTLIRGAAAVGRLHVYICLGLYLYRHYTGASPRYKWICIPPNCHALYLKGTADAASVINSQPDNINLTELNLYPNVNVHLSVSIVDL